MLLGEESRLDFEDTIETESVTSQYPAEFDATALSPVDRRVGVDPADAMFDRGQAALVDKIDLVDENDIGKRELLLGFRGPIDLLQEMPGICDRDDRIELGLAA